MSDSNVSIRGRLQAAENLLAFKSPPDVAEAAKLFLASIFTDPEQNIDHRLAATTVLRRSEDVRIVPAIERPQAPLELTAEEPKQSLHDLYFERLERQNRLEGQEIQVQSDGQVLVLKPAGGNGQDD